jgi:hypothetical protein
MYVFRMTFAGYNVRHLIFVMAKCFLCGADRIVKYQVD